MIYEEMSATADKWLKPDGSVTTMAGDIILPADPERAEAYQGMSPSAAKWLLPDGSIVSDLPASGGGGGESDGGSGEKRPTLYNAACGTAGGVAKKELTGLPEGYQPHDGDFIMVRFANGNTAVSCVFAIADDTTQYQIRFNGLTTNTTASAWKSDSVYPFYFDGTRFNQLCYAKEADADTIYDFFEQRLGGAPITVNSERRIEQYQLVMERQDETFDKVCLSSGTSTMKEPNTITDFKVGGLIFFHQSPNIMNAGSTLSSNIFLTQTYQNSYIIDYALNGGGHLKEYSWVYLIGIPQADPMVYRLDPTNYTSWYTTAKPTTEDGKAYIRLGRFLRISAPNKAFALFADHPAFWFKGGAFRPYLTT